MNYKKYTLIFFSVIAGVTNADEQRSAMTFQALPEAVRYTVSHFIDPKHVTKIEKVMDDGYVKFDIKSTKTVDNEERLDTDVTVAADGEIMTLTKEAPVFAIPFPVMKHVLQQYPDLKVDEVNIVQTRSFLLAGQVQGQVVKLKVYDDGMVQNISTAQTPPPEAAEPVADNAVIAPADSYQKVMPDEGDEPLIDHADYNFDPNE